MSEGWLFWIVILVLLGVIIYGALHSHFEWGEHEEKDTED
jgi:hypothetical protein